MINTAHRNDTSHSGWNILIKAAIGSLHGDSLFIDIDTKSACLNSKA